QFGPNEDFARYPRDLDRDLTLLEAEGVDLVFAPPVDEMYPAEARTTIEVPGLQDRWEGASRPGHFRGVSTIVAKLFRIVLPQRTYFGEKDYQQLQIVRRMAADLLLDVDVIGCPIVREADGLALSSRNVYLDPEQRRTAVALSRALRAAQEHLAAGERRGAALVEAMRSVVTGEPAFTLDYAAIVDPTTLEPLDIVASDARALIAARIGGVRLIDNAPLTQSE
ncbi:MAG: pantoate--beta-alanine ligase, partial [Chloroflexota bacterium]|nr:pantoate--beta-alanine ligase [Chloroflexota bacterium]